MAQVSPSNRSTWSTFCRQLPPFRDIRRLLKVAIPVNVAKTAVLVAPLADVRQVVEPPVLLLIERDLPQARHECLIIVVLHAQFVMPSGK